MKRVAAAVAALALLGAACGDNDDDPLAQTEDNMAELRSGVMDLRLAATAGEGPKETGPVGFRLKGPFSVSSENELAVFNLTYTRLLGAERRVTKVASTGEAAFVTVGDETHRVDDADLGPLRVSDDAPGGLGDLGIADWMREPKVRSGEDVDGEATDTITGQVNVGDMLSDLARVAASVGGDEDLGQLDDDAAERLQKLVRSSSMRVVTTAEDRALRSLRAVVDFGTTTPSELRSKLGPYAKARYEVTLTIKKGPEKLKVKAPNAGKASTTTAAQ